MESSSSLLDLRILVVEDDQVVAQFVSAMLEDARATVVGPCHSVRAAQAILDAEPVDAALLDVNLADGKIFPVAERLAALRVPFLLLSGYGEDAVPADRPGWRALAKPFRGQVLVETLARHVRRDQGAVPVSLPDGAARSQDL